MAERKPKHVHEEGSMDAIRHAERDPATDDFLELARMNVDEANPHYREPDICDVCQ